MPKKDDKLFEQKKRLKDDLKEFSHDCEEILHHHELINDTNFLNRFSEDIQDLESDTLEFSDDPSALMIHYYLSTPMGAPFISRKTMLEAAAAYQNQEPLKSDLYELVDGMIHFGDQEKNPLLLLFKSIEEYLEKEELKN